MGYNGSNFIHSKTLIREIRFQGYDQGLGFKAKAKAKALTRKAKAKAKAWTRRAKAKAWTLKAKAWTRKAKESLRTP